MESNGETAQPFLSYQSSVLMAAPSANGSQKAAVCTDCHGVHQILPASDPQVTHLKSRRRIHLWQVPHRSSRTPSPPAFTAIEAGPGLQTYAGALIRRGEAAAEVTATGARTKFGRTADLVRTAHAVSSQQTAVFRVVRNLAGFNGVLIVALVAYERSLELPAAEIIPLVLSATSICAWITRASIRKRPI